MFSSALTGESAPPAVYLNEPTSNNSSGWKHEFVSVSFTNFQTVLLKFALHLDGNPLIRFLYMFPFTSFSVFLSKNLRENDVNSNKILKYCKKLDILV